MRRAGVLLACLVVAAAAAPARGQGAIEQFEGEVIALVERLTPSVVTVHASVPEPEPYVGIRRVTVSGVVLDGQATIATLGTAVLGATRIEVEVAGGGRRGAKLLGVDERANVGFLETDPEGLVPVPPAPPGATRVGAFALAIGNPFGLTASASHGIVSGIGREVQGVGYVDGGRKKLLYYDMVQTTAPINPGDSGGLLADSRGRMIGMISSSFGRAPSVNLIRRMVRDFARDVDLERVEAFLGAIKMTDEQRRMLELLLDRFREFQRTIEAEKADEGPVEYEGMPEGIPGARLGAQAINFVLPADQVLWAARMIRAHGRVVRLGLRVEVPDPAVVKQLGLGPGEGLVVTAVEEGSPAARAGIEPHDVLLALGPHPLGHPRDLRRGLVACPVTGPIPVRVLHAGERLLRTLRLGE